MTDNLFDRLAELLSAPGPVNWALASELSASMAGQDSPISEADKRRYEALLRTAQLHMTDLPGINSSPSGLALMGRREWAATTVRGFDFLAEPLAGTLGEGEDTSMLPGLFPIMLGLQLGSMVGSMSSRVLGDFDAGLPPAARDTVTLVKGNVDEFISSHELDRDQAELWVVMHELAHKAVMSIPHVRSRFRDLVAKYVGGLELDPDALPFDGLEAMTDPEELAAKLQDPSAFSGMFKGESQHDDLADIRAFVGAVEGFADFWLDGSAKLIPQLPRLREAVDRRRATPSQGEQFLQRLIGMDMQPRRYREGAEFFREVERRWGPEAVTRVWTAPGGVPSDHELTDPVAWAARALLPDPS